MGQYQSLSSFISDLTNRLKSIRKFTLDFFIPLVDKEPFTRSCFNGNSIEILVNDENTRSFLVLRPIRSCSITGLIDVINDLLIRYGQKPYHKDCKVHISIASIRGNVLSWLTDEQRKYYGDTSGKMYGDQPELITHGNFLSFLVDSINCDFGD